MFRNTTASKSARGLVDATENYPIIVLLDAQPPLQLRLLPPPKPLSERLGSAFFRSVPKCPGVYCMHDRHDKIIYVGKSINLRQRLSSYRYLRPEKASRKSIRLIHSVDRITWEVCSDGTQAELRENKLLRTLRPKFNRVNTYHKAYWFIALNLNDSAIELALTRERTGQQLYGVFKPSVVRAFTVLWRWLWIHHHKPARLEDFPAGMFTRSLHSFSIAAASNNTEPLNLSRTLEQFLSGSSDALLALIGSESGFANSDFGKAILASDTEVLAKFFATCQRLRRLSSSSQSPDGLIAHDELDDLLVLQRAPTAAP